MTIFTHLSTLCERQGKLGSSKGRSRALVISLSLMSFVTNGPVTWPHQLIMLWFLLRRAIAPNGGLLVTGIKPVDQAVMTLAWCLEENAVKASCHQHAEANAPQTRTPEQHMPGEPASSRQTRHRNAEQSMHERRDCCDGDRRRSTRCRYDHVARWPAHS